MVKKMRPQKLSATKILEERDDSRNGPRVSGPVLVPGGSFNRGNHCTGESGLVGFFMYMSCMQSCLVLSKCELAMFF